MDEIEMQTKTEAKDHPMQRVERKSSSHNLIHLENVDMIKECKN